MESVDEGSNVNTVDLIAEKKTKKNIGVSQTVSIMSYFQRASLPEANKLKSKKPNSSTTESSALPLKKCLVGEIALDKLQSNCGHEHDLHFQKIVSCDNDESYDSCSDGCSHAGGPAALCVENKMKVCAGEDHKDDETDCRGDIANCHVVYDNTRNVLHSSCSDHKHVNGDHGDGCHGDGCCGDGCHGNNTVKDAGCHGDDTIKDAGCHGNDSVEDGGDINDDRGGDNCNSEKNRKQSSQLNAGKLRWNFTWKPKTKKAKKTEQCFRDSDSDFEEDERHAVNSTEAQVSHKRKGNRKKGTKKRQTKPASKGKSLSKDNRTNSRSLVSEAEKRKDRNCHSGSQGMKTQNVNTSLEKDSDCVVVKEGGDSREGKQEDLSKNPDKEDTDGCDKSLTDIEKKLNCSVIEECKDSPKGKQKLPENSDKDDIVFDDCGDTGLIEMKSTCSVVEVCVDSSSDERSLSKNSDKEDIDNCDDSLIEMKSTCSVVEVCDSSQDKQDLSKNPDKTDIDDGDVSLTVIQCTVDDSNEDLGENMKSDNGKLGVSEKSFFDVLMKNSREKSCAKKNSPELVSEVTDEELEKQSRSSSKKQKNQDKIGNVKDKDVGTKRRDSRKSTRRKAGRKSSVKNSEEDLELDRNDGVTVCKVNNVDQREAKGNDLDGQICSDGDDGVTRKGSGGGSHTDVVSRKSRRRSVGNKKKSSGNCTVVEEHENSSEAKQKISKNPDEEDIDDCDDSLIEMRATCNVVGECEDSSEGKENLSKNPHDCDDSLTVDDNTQVLEENMKSDNGKLGVSEKSVFDVLMKNSRERSCAKKNSPELVSEVTDEELEKQSRSSGKKQKNKDKIGNVKDKDVGTKRKDSRKSTRRKRKRKSSVKNSEEDLELDRNDGVTVCKVNNVDQREAKGNDLDGQICSDGDDGVTRKGSGGGSHTEVVSRKSRRRSVGNKKESSENCTVVEERENSSEAKQKISKNPDEEDIDGCDDSLIEMKATCNVVGECEDSSEGKENLSKNPHDCDDSLTVDDNTQVLEENMKSDNGKLGVSEKSFFDVLMKNSREKSCAKKNSPELVSEVTDEELEKQSRSSSKKQKNKDKIGNVKDKDVGTKRRDSRKSTRRKRKRKSSVKNSEEDLELDRNDGVTVCKVNNVDQQEAEGNDLDGQTCSDGADGVTRKGSEGGSDTEVVTRSHRRSARNKKRSSETMSSLSEGNNGMVEGVDQCDVDKKKRDADDIVAEKQKKRKRSRRLKNKSEKKASGADENSEPSSSHELEAKLSSSDDNKLDAVKPERVPKKTTGPIAPIFLPGAWRRAKLKVEQAKLLDAAIDVDEISEDQILSSSSQDCSAAFKTNVFESTSNNFYPPQDNSEQMQAFMGMFRKSPVKSTVAVVTLIDAPFPKVSHVLQVDDELKEKWNLPMVRNRFVKEEFFSWPGDRYNKSTDLLLLSGLLVIDVQNAEEKTSMWKSLPLRKVTEMSKIEKQAIVKYLKTVYPGFPVRRFIKRCHLQLQRCRKAELETENFDRHLVNKGNLEPRVFTKTVNTDNNQPLSTTLRPTSLRATGKRKTFTKISDKKPIPTSERKKSVETKDSPLLMAFRKQGEQNANSKKDDTKNSNSGKKKKQLPRKNSLRDYLGLASKPDDKSDNSVIERGSGKSMRAKRKRDVEVVEIRRGRTKADRKESRGNKPKKRERESEDDVGNREQDVEECVKPVTKKVKLVQDFKQPKKGKKRTQDQQDREKASESVEIIDECLSTVESVTKSKTAKSPKISSDEDFVKKSKNGDQKVARRTRRTSRGTDNSNTEETGLRKSSRLRKRSSAKEEIECNENNNQKEGTEAGEIENAKDEEKDVEGSKTSKAETKDESVAVLDVQVVPVELRVVVAVEKEPPQRSFCETRAKDAADSLSTVLWTECFRPGRSGEILGNNTAGTKLRNWLSEWKSLRERKLSKMRKHQEKKRERLAARKDGEKPATEWWYEDDDGSDFDMSDDSDDSYGDEEDILCNTVLLTGPTGCGKTSAVYACAEELGLKVIEVNSSSRRGGKYILSELQEATQSHQVARKQTSTETGLGFAPVPKTVSATSDDKNSSKKATEARKKGNKKDRKGEKKEHAKKKSKDESQTTEVVHERMTLILLDEVDILFGEDKGFWVAVNSICLNSKRPIIMTASDPDVNIDGRFEHIILKSPSVEHHAVHLQSTCLSKNVFVSPADLKTLATLHRGDIRRSLLNLQFWIDSSAGGCDPHGTSFVTELEIESRAGETATKETVLVGNDDEDREVVSKTKVTNFPCSENATEGDIFYLASSNQTDGEKSSVERHNVNPGQSVNNVVGLSENVSVEKPEVTLTQCVDNGLGLGNQMNEEKLSVETHEVTSQSQGTDNGMDTDGEKMSAERHGMTNSQGVDNGMDTDGEKLSAERHGMTKSQGVDNGMDTDGEKMSAERHGTTKSQGVDNGMDTDGEKMSAERHGTTKSQGVDNGMDTDGEKLSAERHGMTPTQNVNCVVHQLCLESLLGLRNVTSTTEGTLKVLTAANEAKHSFVYKSSVASHCQALGLDIVSCNLETLLPCLFACINGVDDVNEGNRTNVAKVGHEDGALKETRRKDREHFSEREREAQKENGGFADKSLFDDEAGDQNSRTSESKVVDNTTVAALEILECENDEREVEDANGLETRGVGKKLSAISLDVFGHFLDDMSFMDSELCRDLEVNEPRRGDRFGNWYARVSPGLEDTVDTKSSQLTWKSRTALNEIRGALEVASLERSHKCFHRCIEETGQNFKTKSVELISNASGYNLVSHVSQRPKAVGEISGSHTDHNEAMTSGQDDRAEERGPVGLSSLPPHSMVSNRFEPRSSLQLSSPDEIFIRKTKMKREQDYTTITEYLPDFNQLNRSSIAMDYLPILRNICRNEFLRRASRTKRRFYHYFDLVGLHFLPSAIQLLTDDTFSNCSQDVR